jgi:hypothetical protein
MTKVTITTTQYERDGEFWHETDVSVDGTSIGGGSYGGAPEDNSYWRDYKWVEPLLAKLAATLGAGVTRESRKDGE